MSRHDSELTDEQWNKIEPLLPKVKRSPAGGRPAKDNRSCFEGILWVLRSGARWKGDVVVQPRAHDLRDAAADDQPVGRGL